MSSKAISDIDGRKMQDTLARVVLYGTFALLLFGPLAFGAVEPWSIFLLEAGSTVLFLTWLYQQSLQGQIKMRVNPLFAPMAVFGLLIAAQIVFRTSAYPHDSLSLALLYVAYGLLSFLASQSLLRGSQARRLATILSVYGATVAVFALIQGLAANGRLYWLRAPGVQGWIYGPYVNHNHYAGLMEMLVPIPLVLSLTHLASTKTRNLAAAGAAVMVGTIFLSGSRGGMLAIVAELLLLAIFLLKQKRGLRTAIGMGVFLAIVVGLLTWVGGNELSQRIATMGGGHHELPSDIRLDINRDGLKMFARKPVLGFGLGTFPVVYPQFRSFYTNFFVNEAHNDYLQLLVEMGVVGFLTMAWFVIVAYRGAIKKIGNWTSEISGATALACLLGLSGILVHSAVDFNLQVPANAALFYVLCTLAASEPFVNPMRKRRAAQKKSVEEIPSTEELLHQPATNF